MARPNRIQLLLDRVPAPLRNKFVLTTALFVVWMFFFDSNSILSQYRLQSTLRELQNKQAYFETELKNDIESQRELFTNDKTLEKFAREHHFMKKDDEEVFIFETKEE